MTGVDAAMLANHLGDLGELVGIGVGAWHVNQSARHAPYAVGHRLLGELPHLVELLGRGLPLLVPHARAPQSALRQEMSHVHAGALLVDLVVILAGIDRSAAAIARNDGRAALREVIHAGPRA